MNFKELGLIDPILTALRDEGYTQPTPIQRKAIPPALKGQDVLGCAQTGTGKTCAFAAPILQRLNGKNGNPRVIRALVLTPTRELAIQIGDSFSAYGRNLSLRCAVIFGGVGQQPQTDAIKRGLDILVATPGRLLDLQGQGLLDLSHIEIFVLDEADRMLDMGFIHDVKRVLKLLPAKKQTLFFSATMPPEVMGLVNGLLHNYAKAAVDPVSSPVEAIRQSLYYVDRSNKTRLLAHLLEEKHIPQALVFSRTKHGANRVARDLEKAGISAAAIHGNKSQTARVQALTDFKAGRLRVLVATDIAARGIDIEELGCVFNYNLPDVPETYVHRIGRTGRAGRGGMAISFCQFDETEELKGIEKLLGRPIPVVEDHPWPMVDLEPPMRDKHGKPINAEDREAREAARAKKKEQAAGRDEAPAPEQRKKRSEKVRDAKEQKAAQMPQKPERPAQPQPKKGPAPELVEAATERDLLDYKNRPLTRSVRQGRLQDTLPAQPAMPVADFVKPNPLDSDVIMDATARLLAPRKHAAAPAEATHRWRGGSSRASGGEQSAPEAPSAPQKGAKKKAPVKKVGVSEGEKGPRTVPQPAPAGKKKRHRGHRSGAGQVAPGAVQMSTSTEQRSIMRPYYISHDD